MSDSLSAATSTGAAAGIALILSKDAPDAARAAFSLAATVIALGDPAAIFFTQQGIYWLTQAAQSSPDLDELCGFCQEEGVRFIACSDSLAQTSLSAQDLRPGVEVAGAISFYQFARTVAVSLFI
jgi:predicted peroxiredoxin